MVYDMRRGEVSNKGVQGRWLSHLVRKPSTLDEKSVIIAVTNKHTAKLHHVGSLYIYINLWCTETQT